MIGGMWSRLGHGLVRLMQEIAWAAARITAGLIQAGCVIVGAGLAAMAVGFSHGIVIAGCSIILFIVVHEIGHLVAARLLNVPVAAIHIGGPPALVTIPLRNIELGMGIRPRGRVLLRRQPAVGRHAMVLAAGALANLVTAFVVLVLPIPIRVTWPVALISGGLGLTNLIPFRERGGRLSDGAKLLRLPSQHKAEKDLRRLLASPDWFEQADAADRLLAGWQRKAPDAQNRFHLIARLLKRNGRIEDLVKFHASDFHLSCTPAQEMAMALHELEWAILTVPGLPQPVAELAARRVEWVAKHASAEAQPAVQHTLALARLRQHRFTEVEPLCADALAARLTADQRATVLATVAIARHALRQDSRTPLEKALALDPAAELVSEASQFVQDNAYAGLTEDRRAQPNNDHPALPAL